MAKKLTSPNRVREAWERVLPHPSASDHLVLAKFITLDNLIFVFVIFLALVCLAFVLTSK